MRIKLKAECGCKGHLNPQLPFVIVDEECKVHKKDFEKRPEWKVAE